MADQLNCAHDWQEAGKCSHAWQWGRPTTPLRCTLCGRVAHRFIAGFVCPRGSPAQREAGIRREKESCPIWQELQDQPKRPAATPS